MTTILLHGFWGEPRDWNSVLSKLPLAAEVLIPDLYKTEALAPHPLPKWVEDFWSWVDHQQVSNPLQLVGYSMGGRLALKALLQQPARVSRALLLSANVLFHAEDAESREAWEQNWARAFREDPWEKLEADWQKQTVFEGSLAAPRRRSDDLRIPLAKSLLGWSPRVQNIRAEELRTLKPDVTMAFGALDQKYLAVSKTLQELPVRGQIIVCPGASHRLIWDAAEYVAHWIGEVRER